MHIERPQSRQPIPDHAKKVFTGKIFDVYQWDQVMYDGTTALFDKVQRPDTVLVFPVMDDGKIMMITEQQPGSQMVTHAIGGRMEANEDVIEAAQRELLEETGYTAAGWKLWFARHPETKIDWVIYALIATGLRQVGSQSLDNGERASLQFFTFDELLRYSVDHDSDDKDVTIELLKAQLDTNKYTELKQLFSPL